jgi:hypothetical protein
LVIVWKLSFVEEVADVGIAISFAHTFVEISSIGMHWVVEEWKTLPFPTCA